MGAIDEPGKQRDQHPHAILTVCTEGTCDYDNIQDALDAAFDDDVILVATGVYTDDQTPVAQIEKSITIRGGYTTEFIDPPDPQANPTILDAQQTGRVAYVHFSLIDPITVTLEGLRLMNGQIAGTGGGVYARNTTLVVSGCHAYSNTASLRGGGIYVEDSQAQIMYNQVYSNQATSWAGGGVYLENSDAQIIGNSISNNAARLGGGLALNEGWAEIRDNEVFLNTTTVNGGEGGGLHLQNMAALIQDNRFYDNTTRTNGGGIYIDNASGAVLQNNIIYANTVESKGGGGVYMRGSAAWLNANKVYDNHTNEWGGGFFLDQNVGFTMTNNIITDNEANGASGTEADGVYSTESIGLLMHNTFANSVSRSAEALVVDNGSMLTLANTIVVSYDVCLNAISGSIVAEYTLWDAASGSTFAVGSVSYTNRLIGSPAFTATNCAIDPDQCYHVTASSAALDAGIYAGVIDDIDGDTRPQGEGFELGADEFVQMAQVYLSPGQVRDVYHGVNLNFEHVLVNAGNYTDSFAIDHYSAHGWAVSYTPRITLAHDAAGTIEVNVWIPEGTISGTIDSLYITATSVYFPSAHTSVTNTLLVRLTPQLDLTDGETQMAWPQDWITYTHVLQNQANGPDVFDVECSNDWDTAACMAFVALDMQESHTIIVSLPVPIGTGGLSDVALLSVQSRYDPQVQQVVSNTTHVYHTPGLTLTPGQDGRADPGSTVTYTHIVSNTGNGPDTFGVLCQSDHDWMVECPSTLPLAYNSFYPMVISVTARPGEISGTLEHTSITVTSQSSPTVQQVVTDSTLVNFFVSGVALSDAPDRSSDPSRVITYTHVLTNMGNAPDAFIISHSSSQSWTVEYDSPVTLGWAATRTLLISVSVPTALSGTLEDTVITVASQSDPSAYVSITDTTTINRLAGVQLSAAADQEARPGQIVTYTHIITNTGNHTDTFDITHTSNQGWSIEHPDTVVIGYGASETLLVHVTVPAGTPHGAVEHTTIFAISRYDGDKRASQLDRTTVKWGAILYLPVVIRNN